MILKEGDGTLYKFTKNEDGTYSCGKGEYLKLMVDSGICTVTTKAQTKYEFDNFLRLEKITDIDSNIITLAYDDRGNLHNVTNHYITTEDGDSITFEYTASTISGEPDKLAAVTDASGRVYHFEYNDAGRFVGSYILYSGSIRYGEQYAYGSNDMISAIITPGGKLYTVVYDSDNFNIDNKVLKIRNPISSIDPDNTSETMVIAYSGGAASSTYRHAVNTYNYNSNGLLTNETNPLNVTTSYTYDPDTWDMRSTSFNNIVYNSTSESVSTAAVTDQYTYDNNGNIQTHTRPDGKVEYYTYNIYNQVTLTASPFRVDEQDRVIYTYKTYNYNADKKLTDESGLTEVIRNQDGSFSPIDGAHQEGTVKHFDYYDSGNTNNAYEYGLLKSETDKGYDTTNNEIVAYGMTTYKYDSKRRLIETDYPDGSSTKEGYDTYPDQTAATTYGATAWTKDGNGAATLYYYDILGRQTKVYYDSSNMYTLTTYDLDGNTKLTVNKNSIAGSDITINTTTLKYDSLDRPISEVDNGVTTATLQYSTDSSGNITTIITDADGVQGTTKEDKAGQQYYSEISGEKSYTLYDNAGNTIAEYSNTGTLSETFYDEMGNVLATADDPDSSNLLYGIPSSWEFSPSSTPDNMTTVNVYDLAGNAIESMDYDGTITTVTYDSAARETSETVSNETTGFYTSNTSSYSVDQSLDLYKHQKITVKDGNGYKKDYFANYDGRLYQEHVIGDSEDPYDDVIIFYDHDVNGNLTKLTRCGWEDGIYKELNQEEYKYYDSTNTINAYEYGKLRQVSYGKSDDHYVTYSYYPTGKLKTMKQVIGGQADVTNTYEYDSPLENDNALYSMTQETRDEQVIGEYDYTKTGKLKKIRYTGLTSGDEIGYKYNVKGSYKGKLDEVYDVKTGNTIREYNYSDGKLDNIIDYRDFNIKMKVIKKTKEKFTYNSKNELTGINYLDYNLYDLVNSKYAYVSKEKYAFSYYKTGNIKTETITTNYGEQPVVTQKSYTYDTAGNLNGETVGTSTTSYTYDKAGNRKTMDDGTYNYEYKYDALNQLKEIWKTSRNGDVTCTIFEYHYKMTGNEFTKHEDGVTTLYLYDRAGRLVKVTKKPDNSDYETTIATYKYDGADRRIEQTAGGSTTKYYYFYNNLLYTTDATGNMLEENIIEPFGGIICSKRFSGNYSDKYYFYRQDIRGSVTNIIDKDGKFVKGLSYNAYGKTIETGDPNFINDAAYTGTVYDNSTGLYYKNDGRYYDPATGRFLEEKGERGVKAANLFAYSGNDPVNDIHKTGYVYGGRYASYYGSLDTIINDMIQYGRLLVGRVKYGFGDTLPTSWNFRECYGDKVDCQGFVKYMYNKFFAGTKWLPKRSTSGRSYYVRAGARYQVDQCRKYGWLLNLEGYDYGFSYKRNLKPGNLVFYHTSNDPKRKHWSSVTHVGIYIGNHQVIQSTTWKKNNGVCILTLEKYHPAKCDTTYYKGSSKYISFIGSLFMDREFKPKGAYIK